MVKYKVDAVLTVLHNAFIALEELKSIPDTLSEIHNECSDKEVEHIHKELDRLEAQIKYFL
jgi:hypothetical protein